MSTGFYVDIDEIKEIDNEVMANAAFKVEGWSLLAIKEKSYAVKAISGQPQVVQGPVYVFGHKRKAANAPAAPKPPTTPTTQTPPAQHYPSELEKLDWMPSNYGGEWIPADKAPSWAKDVIKQNGEKGDKGWKFKDPVSKKTYTCSTKGNIGKYEEKS
jgi:hypothetical protein